MKKYILIMGILLLSMVAVACSGPEPEAPAAAPAVEEVAEEAMEEEMAEEEMAEEAMEEEMAEEEVAEEAMEEEMMEDDMGNVTYVVNAADSSVAWTGAKAVGDTHTGTIDISEGELVIENGELVSGSFVLDMTTIANSDLSGNMQSRLEGHLKSPDFFGVDTYPTASLTILSATAAADGQYDVSGELTIKEITHPIEFVTTVEQANGALSATADIVFDRALYDVQFGSSSFFSDLGDDLINDEVEISVELAAASQ